MIDPPAGALLAVMFDLQMPSRVEETLCVYPNGRLWYWSLAAAATERRNRVGTFTATLDSRTQQAVRQLAIDLLALKPLPAPATPSGAAITLRVALNGRQQGHIYYQGSGVPDALQTAHTLLQTLLANAEAGPYSVVQMAVRGDAFPLSAPTSNGIFLFENPGTQIVTFTLIPDAFTLAVTLRNGQALGAQNAGKPMTELTDSDGKSHGGIYAPAQFAPGERAALSFLEAIHAAPTQVAAVAGVAQGNITLHYPGRDPNPFPDDAFILNA